MFNRSGKDLNKIQQNFRTLNIETFGKKEGEQKHLSLCHCHKYMPRQVALPKRCIKSVTVGLATREGCPQ